MDSPGKPSRRDLVEGGLMGRHVSGERTGQTGYEDAAATIRTRNWGLSGNLTWQRSEHTYKTGLFFNVAYKAQQPSWDMGTFNFSPSAQMLNDTNSGLANLLLGNYQTYTQSNGI